MKYFFFIFLAVFSTQIYANEPNCYSVRSQDLPKTELVFLVTTNELVVTDEGISIHYNGELLNVNSLERIGQNWEVRVGSTCPKGHPMFCWYCRGCAASDCPYRCPGDCRPH